MGTAEWRWSEVDGSEVNCSVVCKRTGHTVGKAVSSPTLLLGTCEVRRESMCGQGMRNCIQELTETVRRLWTSVGHEVGAW